MGENIIGGRIKFLRELRGLTLEQVGNQAGVMPSTLSLWETGKRSDPHVSTLRKVAGALGCTIDYLVGISDYPTPQAGCGEPCPDAHLQTLMAAWPILTDEGKRVIAGMVELLAERQRQLREALGGG